MQKSFYIQFSWSLTAAKRSTAASQSDWLWESKWAKKAHAGTPRHEKKTAVQRQDKHPVVFEVKLDVASPMLVNRCAVSDQLLTGAEIYISWFYTFVGANSYSKCVEQSCERLIVSVSLSRTEAFCVHFTEIKRLFFASLEIKSFLPASSTVPKCFQQCAKYEDIPSTCTTFIP